MLHRFDYLELIIWFDQHVKELMLSEIQCSGRRNGLYKCESCETHELAVKVKCEAQRWMIWNNTTFASMQTLFSFQCTLGSGWIETGIFFVMFTTQMFKTSLLCLLWPLKQVFQNNSPAYIMSWCLYLQTMRGPNLESGDNVNLRCLWTLLHHPQRRPSSD